MHVARAEADDEMVQLIREISQAKYARPRKEVEAEIERRPTMFGSLSKSAKTESPRTRRQTKNILVGESTEGWNGW